jgi:L,D-peptidoglycan transpeptidase YkuD (ErfK/YbiS/YcfS/YnhG family)/tetratricopeptide (TPR) repeat protein
MKTHFRSVGFFCCLCCLLITAGLAPPAHAEGPQWVEIRSPHFSVATDAGEKRGREVAMRFEQMRAVFATLIIKAKVNIPIPLEIVAFRNTKELRQFAPLWHGKPTQVSGLFQGGEDRSFIMLDMSVENPWRVVFHEYAHQLMNGILSREMDPWFEEGFAEYFSTIDVDNKEARVGKPPPYAYLELRQAGMIKIADLFKVRQDSQTYNETSDRRTVFYAESNMLVHYLHDNGLVPKATIYFNLRDKNVPVEDAIQQAFGMSADQLDKALSEYVGSGHSKYYVFPTPADIAGSGYTAVPLSPADSNAILADIHLHSRDYRDKAIEEFQDILKTDPNHAASCRGLGYAYLQKRQFDQAAAYFRRAAQLDSKNPRVHYYSALLMSREGGFSNRAHLPEMTKELETAIALDPTFADSYRILAFAQAYRGDRVQGLETMRKAVSLSPRNESYQYDLAQIYMSNRQFDHAIDLLQALERTQDQRLALRVRETLLRAQQMKEAPPRIVQLPGSAPAAIEPEDEPDDSPDDSSDKAPVTENPAAAREAGQEPAKNLEAKSNPGVPLQSSTQILVVTTSDWNAVEGTLQRYERSSPDKSWKAVGEPFRIVVGKNGLALSPAPSLPDGVGRRSASDPVKKEGDGKAPAGVFPVSTAFGYASQKQPGWKMPFVSLTPSTECVDDTKSKFYNRVLDRSNISSPDWNSSEHMLRPDELYRWGLEVDYNPSPAHPGDGSCIFLHIWRGAGQGTAGCTAMPQEQLESVLAWLDPARKPLLVQFPQQQYRDLQQEWGLPPLPPGNR